MRRPTDVRQRRSVTVVLTRYRHALAHVFVGVSVTSRRLISVCRFGMKLSPWTFANVARRLDPSRPCTPGFYSALSLGLCASDNRRSNAFVSHSAAPARALAARNGRRRGRLPTAR